MVTFSITSPPWDQSVAFVAVVVIFTLLFFSFTFPSVTLTVAPHETHTLLQIIPSIFQCSPQNSKNPLIATAFLVRQYDTGDDFCTR